MNPTKTWWPECAATESASVVLAPGEEYGHGHMVTWGLVLGQPTIDRGVMLTGTREEILTLLAEARTEVEAFCVAEHENAYHVEVEPGCPVCATDGPTVKEGN